MNTLSDIAFFAQVAQTRNLSAAAQALGVTTAAVSRRLSALEGRLGIRLLNRTTRRAALTEEGALYLEEGLRLLTELEELEQRVAGRQGQPRGLLRVNAGFGFGRHFIGPAIAGFVKKFPGVEVQLQLTDRPLQLSEDGMDVCVRFGPPPDARVTSRKLASNRRLLVASPTYLREHGLPAQPQDLRTHRCIFIRERDEVQGQWQLQQVHAHDKRPIAVKVGVAVTTNDGEVALDWALQGLGILQRSEWHVAPYLRSGRLQAVLPEWEHPGADIHVVYPARKNLSAKVVAFVDHLSERFAHLGQGPGGAQW